VAAEAVGIHFTSSGRRRWKTQTRRGGSRSGDAALEPKARPHLTGNGSIRRHPPIGEDTLRAGNVVDDRQLERAPSAVGYLQEGEESW